MKNIKNKSRFLNISILKIVGVAMVTLLAIVLLWHGNANSMQSVPALVADVYFDGEYRIADGNWQPLQKDEHISSTKGDVTLKGNFHMLAPDGQYVGIYNGDIPIAFYTDHINLTFFEGKNEPFVIDIENELYGDSSCGVSWTGYTLTTQRSVGYE